jgi:hypothetical protein
MRQGRRKMRWTVVVVVVGMIVAKKTWRRP